MKWREGVSPFEKNAPGYKINKKTLKESTLKSYRLGLFLKPIS
jgi:hypothetical protein